MPIICRFRKVDKGEILMSYIIPDNLKKAWKTQAQSAGMAYSTVVGQHIYDLQGLVEVLKQQLQQAMDTLKTLPNNSSDYEPTEHKITNLKAKLDHTEQQLAAYQAEQQQGGPETTPSK